MKKRFLSILLIVCLIVSACALFACNNDTDDTPAEPTLDTFVSIDINPSVEMTVDSDNKVVSAYGANDDGKILIYGQTLVGMDVDKAVKKIIELAVDYGYLSEDNNVVTTGVVSTNVSIAGELNTSINSTITETAGGLGLSVTTDAEASFSTQCEMEELKAQYPTNQAIQNMSLAKYKLAMTVAENGTTDIETIFAMDDNALIENAKSVHNEIKPYALEEYQRAEEEANVLYQKSVEFAKDMVYVEFFAEKLLSNPFANAGIAYFGALYCMYTLPAKGFELLAQAGQCVIDYKEEELDATAVQRIMNALGLDESELDSLKNEDGEVTINSVEKYVNNLFKNSSAGVKLEEIKANVKEALSEVKGDIKEAVAVFKDKHEEEITAIIETAESYISAVETLVLALPDSVKTEINRYLTDFKDIVNGVKTAINDGLTVEELSSYAENLRIKADVIREDMLNKLTDADKSNIATRQEEAVANLNKERQELLEKIESAKQKAESRIRNRQK